MKRLSLICLVFAAVCSHASAKAPDKTYAANQSVAVSLTLLPEGAKVGRNNPFYDGYRPEFQFSATKEPVMCTVNLPSHSDKVEPGETRDVTLTCIESFSVADGQPAFVFYEGGRKVGQGVIKP